jgi:uncharacterized lipoprotein NlpE involved in copper resistance
VQDACIHADNAPVHCDSGANCTKQWDHNWVHDCREKCVRCDDNSRGCDINHCVVFNCGQPLRNGAPAGILVKGDRNKVWACTIFNASTGGQGDLVGITEFGQNKHSLFLNVAAERIATRGGLPLSCNSTNFTGGLVTGNISTYLVDPSRHHFMPKQTSPLFGRGVVHAPEAPTNTSAHLNVGAYQSLDSWHPGCTFHPRCKLDDSGKDFVPETRTRLHSAAGRHFATVQSCVDAAARSPAGGTCLLGAGTHRESVIFPTTRAGPVTLAGQPDGSSTLTGSMQVNSSWILRGKGVYEARLPEGTWTDQLFVDGVMAFEARWPNTNLTSVLNQSSWAVSINSSSPSLTDPRSLGFVSAPSVAATGLNFTGAMMTLNAGTRVWTWTRRVVKHTPGESTLWYRGGLMPERGRASKLPTLFFLSGPQLLDSPMEWWLDTSRAVLALRLHGSVSPAGARVEIKQRSRCISTGVWPAHRSPHISPPIHIANLSLQACTFDLADCHSCSVRTVSLRYPSHTSQIYFRDFPKPDTLRPIVVTTLSGNDSLIERLHLQHSSITGLLLLGNRNTARDILIESTNWLGSLDFPAVQIGFAAMLCNNSNATNFDPAVCGHDRRLLATSTRKLGTSAASMWYHGRRPAGEGNVLTRLTVARTGGGAVVTSQFSNEVSWSRIVDGQLIGLDQAGIHADNLGAHGFPQDAAPLCALPETNSRTLIGPQSGGNCSKQWHHNWIFRQREKCVRGDDGTVGLSVHHSVIYDCGLGSPAMSSQRASPAGVLLKGDHNAFYQNVVWNTRGQGDLVVDTRHGPPCTKAGCVPENMHSVFLNSAQRRIATKGPHGWRNGTFNASVSVVGGMVHAENVSQLGLRDPANFDFRPTRGSLLRGAGVHYPPYVSEARPDVGAYQSSEPLWIAGCNFHPRCDAR